MSLSFVILKPSKGIINKKGVEEMIAHYFNAFSYKVQLLEEDKVVSILFSGF